VEGARAAGPAVQWLREEKGDQLCVEERICFMATELNLKGGWNEAKGKLKQKYGQLTDDDLAFADGKSDELLGRLQQKLGRTKEDIRAEIEKM
jgi:uncharacterized protein YjbJ (UPF0337 family)